MKRLINIIIVCSFVSLAYGKGVLYSYNANELPYSPNLFTCGYSYSYNGSNDIWLSTYGIETSLAWQKTSDRYWNVKLGYQPFSFFSMGVVFSWQRIKKTENNGIGMYSKLTLPIRYVSPFIYGQIATNKNNTFGCGITINLGYK